MASVSNCFTLWCVTTCKDLKTVRQIMRGQYVNLMPAMHALSLKRNGNSYTQKKVDQSYS